MNKNGIRGMALLLLACGTSPAVFAQPPEQLPESTQGSVPIDEVIPYDGVGGGESTTYVARHSYHGGFALTRWCSNAGARVSEWWNTRAKPHLQYSHWGYPEYFEEPPHGASVRATQSVQICSGWTSRLMLYHYDFCDGAPSLNLHGQRRLNDLAGAHHIWMHHILRVQATPGSPQLDLARRDYVAQVLADAGVPTRVEVGYPTEVSPFGDEIRKISENVLRRVHSGRPIGGTVGGSSSSGGSSSGGSGDES